jgi:REP element-mobilizing transposase RayT
MYDPERHHRRSIRLKAFDYRTPGAYVVTVCTRYGACLFGQISEAQMQLSSSGQMVLSIWDEIPAHYPGIDVDAFIVMPNHIHGILVLLPDDIDPDPDAWRGSSGRGDLQVQPGFRRVGHPQGDARTGGPPCPPSPSKDRLSLPDVVHRFKSLTTKRYGEGVHNQGWPPYDGRLRHRNYFERVIRNERELERFREHIDDNPARWIDDQYNPAKLGSQQELS